MGDSPDTRRKKRRHRAGPPLGREFRFFAADGLEVRNDGDNDAILISGMPIVYDTPYSVRDMFGEFEETMLPGVARDVLAAGADVRFLFDHKGMPLARTLSRTLTLDGENPQGVAMTASLDARSSLASDLAVAIERGDVNQMSCGFVVAQDEWTNDGTQRSISKFGQLFDVSAVTFPASPTTSVELAFRSLLSQPIESQARTRQLWVAVGRDFREGRSLSADNAAKLQQALAALAVDEDVDVEALVRDIDPESADDTDTDADAPEVDAAAAQRAALKAAERRGDMTYSDVEAALSDALLAKYGPTDDDDDAWLDMWVVDATDEWVVWRVCGDVEPGNGLWRSAYTLTDGVVTLTGDPVAVTTETTYVPAIRGADPAAALRAAFELQQIEIEREQMQMRARRRRPA